MIAMLTAEHGQMIIREFIQKSYISTRLIWFYEKYVNN